MEPLTVLGLALIALLGLLVGTVADGVAARVPEGAPVLSALRPQCACGEARHGREALPLVWLFGRRHGCPQCGLSSGVRRATLETAGALLFLTLGLVLGLSWQLPAYLYLAALCLALTAIDLATLRLPLALTIPAYPFFAGLLLLPAFVDGHWAAYGRAALGGLAMFSVYVVLVLVNPAGMGLGDVWLSGVLGMALAWFGWHSWVVGAVAAFVLSAVVGIGLLVTRRAGLKTLIPFGPFMMAGAFLAIVGIPLIAGLALAGGALG